MRLQHMAWPEYQHAPRQDWHFLTRLGVTANATPFLPDRKGPEATDFNRFTFFKVGRDAIQDVLKQVSRLVP